MVSLEAFVVAGAVAVAGDPGQATRHRLIYQESSPDQRRHAEPRSDKKITQQV